MERVQALIDLQAIRHNCRLLRERLSARALLCAVVKADGYGHGAEAAARAAREGGATYLAVATAAEAVALRAAGLGGRLLVMGPLTTEELAQARQSEAEVVIWREWMLERLSAAGGGRIHLKFDTGMGRLGSAKEEELLDLLRRAKELQGVEVVGVMSHFATADEGADSGYFETQLAAFASFAAKAKGIVPTLLAHTANSAALLRDQRSHFDMARCGIALYGLDPFGADAGAHGLRPALTLRSYVADVKRLCPGDSVGYGRLYRAPRSHYIGIVPVGYADGFRRGLSGRAEVLVSGKRRRQLGAVSMDTIAIDLGEGEEALRLREQEVVVIGRQGEEEVSAEELARLLGTINYEVTCGIGPRVPRRYADGRPA